MARLLKNREIIAAITAVIFLIIGACTVWLVKTILRLEGDALYITLLVIPILVYLIFSGRLTELKGPGGLEAKFVNIAKQSAELSSETIEASVSEMGVVTKSGTADLQMQMRHLDESKPIIMTLKLGGLNFYYSRDALLHYIESLFRYRSFKFVVLLDNDDKFVAYLPAFTMERLLRTTNIGEKLVQVINDGDINQLRLYPGVVTKTLTIDTSNVDALRELTTQNLEALVVTDSDNRLKGVVERDQIISKMLLGISR